MKRSILHAVTILFAACAAIVTTGCGGDDTPSTPQTAALRATPQSLDFTADSYSQTISVESSGGRWLVSSADGWCQTDVTSGSGNGTVNVSVSANPEQSERSTRLTLRMTGADDVVVTVRQSAPGEEGIVVEPDPWDGVKRADITYQLLIYSFADSDGDGMGDFRGIISKLDYLDRLGVSAIWLSPAHPAASYHGYDVKDYEALNPAYGTEEDFKALIDAAHEHGIKVYMDYVINHTSKEHPWFVEALSGEDNPFRGYYVLSNDPAADIAAGRIPMIATEGASGYDAGQWFAAVTSASAEPQKLRFTLRWSAAPTLTVDKVDDIENSGTPAGKYLYYGNPGKCAEFFEQEDGTLALSLEFSSPWGCLVRTSSTSWAAGTKYGAKSGADKLAWGEPLTLMSNSSTEPKDILLPGMESVMYHSHFWTDWFADLDYGSAEECEQSDAFKAVSASTHKWIDMGIDGLRLDGAKHVYHNAASNENPLFWNKFYNDVNEYFRRTHSDDIYMVGEVYSDYNEVAPYYFGLPSLFEFSYWYRLEWALNNATGCHFAKDILSYRELYATVRADYIEATKLTNHDESRARSLLGGSIERAKTAGAVLLTSCGSPYVYYGEELGYVGRKDNGDEYVRPPMKWGDASTTTFIDKIYAGMDQIGDVAAQSADEESILNVYRTFSQLRNTYPALATGEMTLHPTYNSDNTRYKQIAAWYRTEGAQRMLVLHNFSNAPTTLTLDDDIEKAVAVLGSVSSKLSGSTTTLRLGGYSSAVFMLK